MTFICKGSIQKLSMTLDSYCASLLYIYILQNSMFLSFVLPQAMTGPEKWLSISVVPPNVFSQTISGPETQNLGSVFLVFVFPQCISGPGYFAADITRVGDSCEVVGFNVSYHI